MTNKEILSLLDKEGYLDMFIKYHNYFDNKYNYFRRSSQYYYKNSPNLEIDFSDYFYLINWFDELHHCNSMKIMTNYVHSYNARRKRLENRILDIIAYSDNRFFLTLTFRDEFIDLKYSTLFKYVQNFLKTISDDYVANVDFAPETNRIHFHAVVHIDSELLYFNKDLEKYIIAGWPYGFSYLEYIDNPSPDRLATYITKLSAHALKDSNLTGRVIYSRSVRHHAT